MVADEVKKVPEHFVSGLTTPDVNAATLLERQGKLSKEVAKSPTAIVTSVLAPDLMGLIVDVKAEFNTMEQPSEVKVIAQEKGIMDDDLLGVTHTIELLKNKNGDWHIVDYQREELRR